MLESPAPDLLPFAVSVAQRMDNAPVVLVTAGRVPRAGVQNRADSHRLPTPYDMSELRTRFPGTDWRSCTVASGVPDTEQAPVLVLPPDVMAGDPEQLSPVLAAWLPVIHSAILASVGGAIGPLDDRFAPITAGYSRGPSSAERSVYIRVVPGGSLRQAMTRRADAVDVLAIVPCFNEEDIIATTVTRLRSQGVRVHLVENWSTDRTWQIATDLCADDSGVTAERFPDAPSSQHQWQRILDRMDDLGAESSADWILHVDADEALESYSPGVTLREAIATADAAGFDAFDCTVVDFRPTAASPGADGALPEYWEFGLRHGHRHIERAWRNRGRPVGLSVAGGHVINEPKRLFPLNLLLRHYPLRSAEHAARKIFRDRLPRFQNSPGQLEHGWHRQYDGYRRDDPFLWDAGVLQRWEGDSTRERWMVEMTTKVGLSFGEGSYTTSPFAEQTRSRRSPYVDAARRRWRAWRDH